MNKYLYFVLFYFILFMYCDAELIQIEENVSLF